MSLAVLADHMASKGRGPDSMLIHMSPREVQGLQALAMKHGGSLTINPETGLPEAGFLDKLLPAIIGFALAPMTAGTSLAFLGATPLASAMTVGALQTLRTGDLGKGIMAGFGAYGGASLGANLATAGTGAISSEVGGKALETAGLTGEAALTAEADQIAQNAIGEKLAASTPFEKIAAGAGQATSSPEAMGQFAGKNWRAGLAAISPVLADEGVKSNMPTTVTRPGQVRTFSYNPYEQLYTPTGNYEVPVKAAGGGLMGLAAGGMAGYGDGDDISRRTNDGMAQGGMYDFAQRSEPVVRMAEGGAPPAINSVADLYQSVLGRGVESEGAAGYWANQFGPTIDANEIAAFRAAAAPELAARTTQTTGLTGNAATQAVDTSNAGLAALNTNTTGGMSLAAAQADVGDIYRNVLGRDVDPTGLNYWSQQFANSNDPNAVYNALLASARQNTELIRPNAPTTFADASKDYTGFMSTDTGNIVDEWVRTTLGREPTDADRQQQWYKDAADKMTTQGEAQGLFGQFKTYAGAEASKEMTNRIRAIDAELRAKGLTDADLLAQTGKTKQQLASEGLNTGLNLMSASQLAPAGSRTAYDLKAKLAALKPIPNTFGGDEVDRTITNRYGNATNPGDKTYNPDGSITVTPNIPYRPYGGFSGMEEVRDAYTRGGGSLGYIPDTPKTMEEFDEKYNTLTGGSREAYDRLTGKTKYSPVPYTETGEVMKPYAESVMGATIDKSAKKVLFDPVTRKYKNNPDYIPVSYNSEGKKVYGLSGRDIAAQLPDMPKSDYEKWVKDNNVTHAQIAEALNISLAEAKKRYPLKTTDTTNTNAGVDNNPPGDGGGGGGEANGGLMGMARGGMAQQFNLGDYSDGGRLLRGPGDGVSDSIPASIGGKRPARLADGEFVVPARIVSELGNGSTEAGARKLYAMMDRVQKARRGTVGKGRVAKNSRSEKYLPA